MSIYIRFFAERGSAWCAWQGGQLVRFILCAFQPIFHFIV